MELLVAYDVSTTDTDGAKRLRKVAKLCEAHGQRVQQSVFECTLNAAQKEQFVHELTEIIDEEQDSLRLYRLQQPKEKYVEVVGKTVELDMNDPLIV
ncbi:MAG: CRISPR-associated endonuclease Cas2 [Chloroflexota bacterium]